MCKTSDPIVLAPNIRKELEAMVRSTRIRAGLGRRARLILALAGGATYLTIRLEMKMGPGTITRWKSRFQRGGVQGLMDAPRSGRGHGLSAAKEARILQLPTDGPPAPYTHWSVRRLARRAAVSHMTLQRVLAHARLKPHRLKRYTESTDPEFETNAADIIGLYINSRAYAAVLCVDEKTAIQALDRRDPALPLPPGRAERHGFEYVRHGTHSLYPALQVDTGEVDGMSVAHPTAANFVRFLDRVVATQPRRKEIHIICDNLSAHKGRVVAAWLQIHPNVSMHYTPTYSSWLNQVEIWSSKIQRDLNARGILTSAADLCRQLMQYIRAHNKSCHPFVWRYSNPKRRIRSIAS
jgi:transposase